MSTPEIRTIPGFPDYGASEDGRIWRLTPFKCGRHNDSPLPRTLAACNICGSLAVSLRANPETKSSKQLVGRMVLTAWDRPPLVGEVVQYIDKDTNNVTRGNLRWRVR